MPLIGIAIALQPLLGFNYGAHNVERVRKTLWYGIGAASSLSLIHILNSLSEMKDELAVFMGGRVAEEIFCDDITTGASNDLERASKMARAIVTQYGMLSLIHISPASCTTCTRAATWARAPRRASRSSPTR